MFAAENSVMSLTESYSLPSIGPSPCTKITQNLVRQLSDRCNALIGVRGTSPSDIAAMRERYRSALCNITMNAAQAVEDTNCLRELGCDSDRFADVCPRAYRYAAIGFNKEVGYIEAVSNVSIRKLEMALRSLIKNLSVTGIMGHLPNPALDCLAHCFLMGAFANIMSAALLHHGGLVEPSNSQTMNLDIHRWERAYVIVTQYLESSVTVEVDVAQVLDRILNSEHCANEIYGLFHRPQAPPDTV